MAGGADPLAGLNPAQRQAAEAVRGPVAILAGAGTGKTTTITHRIAHQVRSGTFEARQVLAVTFTEKAAGELKRRLARLGVEGVEARTFHASALRQLGTLWPRFTGRDLPEVLNAKAQILNPIANGLPGAYRFLPRRELAGEIEWAKNRLVNPAGYLEAIEAAQRTPPLPLDLMQRTFMAYERTKGERRMDFEDMLLMLVRVLDDEPEAARLVHERFHAFTVDEYQDVNPLQQALLDRWLDGRDELCVVGDDYQTIYTFTGASPEHLLGFPDRYPNATVVRLEENYRSSPQVLTVANALAAALGGFEKTLRATRGDGPNPTARALSDAEAEVAFVIGEARRLHDTGVPWEQIAVLYRINARSEPYEEALAAAGVPYQVRDGSFLRRPGPRGVIARLRRVEGVGVAEAVEAITDAIGYAPGGVGDDAGEEEATRQADLGRLRALAAEYAGAAGNDASPLGFLAELEHRFAAEREGRGVQLMTFHRAKGLEFDAVFLPRLLDGELPYRARRSEADPDEERRLLYVGITRAREHLFLSWPRESRTAPSPFLREIGVVKPEPRRAGRVPAPSRPLAGAGAGGSRGPLFDRLKEWRRRRASTDGVPAYVVFHDATLAEIAERKPRDWADLAGVPGVGPAKLDRYADEVLAIVAGD
ncbi:MAG TPA: ATP-dependent DNA helicase UvrD2 [Actinomycetota bacterium]|nr:ATP-dependent DNA helicase UvrD2 [Actinomycetota bacterium]